MANSKTVAFPPEGMSVRKFSEAPIKHMSAKLYGVVPIKHLEKRKGLHKSFYRASDYTSHVIIISIIILLVLKV